MKQSTVGNCIQKLIGLVEDVVISLDFISDARIIRALFLSKDVFWMCITVTTVAWPFYVAMVPFLNFKLDLLRKIFIE